ncbi:uncharacterized protein LOC117103620 [Anneissia japonica]|uniref:uncharacterized protein LOC117103620 n=1 Tax=Anneissia japonica TaxID=1529436 RepID=UPI001425906E|nr:uncharacterized protein LOC117103620 [Anneissia japonica]
MIGLDLKRTQIENSLSKDRTYRVDPSLVEPNIESSPTVKMHGNFWLRFLEIYLLVQTCNAYYFSINHNNNNIEGAGVCGCEFTCEAFQGSGATMCYIIYREDGMWRTEDHQLVNERFLEQRECITGNIRQHCYMLVVYENNGISLSCQDSHQRCQRASGGIARMDTNHELYDFSNILANYIPNEFQKRYSYKTIAEDIWVHNAVLKNTCASVQSLNAYDSNIQASGCRSIDHVNSIICENAPLPISTYCASPPPANPPTLKSGQTTKKPRATATASRSVTYALRPGGTPFAPKQFTNALNPTVKSNPGPGVPNLWPTWWPWVTETTTKQTTTKKTLKKKKKMVVNHNEPHNDTKKKKNATHLIAGIFFVGTIVMVGVALMAVCFFRYRHHEEQPDITRWSNASDPPKNLSITNEKLNLTKTYAADMDARNAASDYEHGYSVIHVDKRRKNDSVRKNLSLGDCRRYRLSKQKYDDVITEGAHYQQDIKLKPINSPKMTSTYTNARDVSTYKARVRSHNVIDRMSSGRPISMSSRSSMHYEINDFVKYDQAGPYVVSDIQEPSYDYAYASTKRVKKKKSKRQRIKHENNVYGDV